MEAIKEVSSGVRVVGSDAATEYHIAPRSLDNSLMGFKDKKKRGRPRKYGPDGPVSLALSPKPISVSVPAAVIDFSSEKRPKMKHATVSAATATATATAAVVKQHQTKYEAENIGECVSSPVGPNFTPHIITALAGEDVTMKVMSFSQQGPRAICILSANGVISSVTLRQPNSSGGTLTYEGRFEILSLSGSFMPSESGGIRNRSGGMSVSLANSNGGVIGGSVAGLLIAAAPVQIVVGSFLAGNKHEQNTKKQKSEFIMSGAPPSSTVNFSSIGIQENYRGSQNHGSATRYSSSFPEDAKNGSTGDHNESYHEG